MKPSINFFILSIALFSISFSSCKKDEEVNTQIPTPTPVAQTGMFKVEFEHVFNGLDFSLGSVYVNALGQDLKFSQFDYRICNIKLSKSDGTFWSQPESYFLLKSNDALSRLLTISNVPVGEYTGITFTIGVDSVRNSTGAQTGALDPANGMYWGWNTGYVFIKAEGTSSLLPNAAEFQYHIGGSLNPNSTIRTVSHSFAGAVMTIAPNTAPQIHMAVDLSRLFNGNANLDITSTQMVHMPGADASAAADRFQEAFEFEHLHE